MRIILAVLLSYPLLMARGLSAQSLDARADTLLRQALQVPPGQALAVSRNYNPRYFPGATFYYAEMTGGCVDCGPRHAAVVTARDTLYLVDGLEALSGLWPKIIVNYPLDAVKMGDACRALLVQTGYLSVHATVIRRVEDIPLPDRKYVNPHGLEQVRSPVLVNSETLLSIDEFLFTGFEVLEIRCELGKSGFRASTALVARSLLDN